MDAETISGLKTLAAVVGWPVVLALFAIGRLFAAYINKNFFRPYLAQRERELTLREQGMKESENRTRVLESVSGGLTRVASALEHGTVTFQPRVVKDTDKQQPAGTGKSGKPA